MFQCGELSWLTENNLNAFNTVSLDSVYVFLCHRKSFSGDNVEFFSQKIIFICGLHGAQSQFFAQLQNVRNLFLKNNSIRRHGKVFLDWICEVLEFLRYNV